ncbi:MAG: tetratricopeptide repeat protein [Saprospiraceae bacterium]|nr:MAG: tetratricopeptide repeat protein [Saprospiraceae bacterium]
MQLSKLITHAFLWFLVVWCGNSCLPDNDNPAPYLHLQDGAHNVGMATCRSCHNDAYLTFMQTGMGQSLGLANRQKSAARFDAQAVVYDTLNDFYYFPFFNKDSVLQILEYRLENGDTVHQRLETVSYIVGSGQHTNSHILDINGYFYQAPVTWYAQEQRWDLAPGFRENNSRFGRFLTIECISCHNQYPTPVPGSLNKFSEMPTGIECERCHGPGSVHVQEKLAGHLVDTAQMADPTIVNPRRLPRDLQLDLCQRCHLQGVAVLNEGKTFYDFRPGMKLNDVMNVFLPRFTNSDKKFIMASQADRLRLSKCFKNSKSLSCLTCHHPHHSVKTTPSSKYRKACLSCHSQNGLSECSATAQERAKASDRCEQCHMPASGTTDIPHVHITDHRIAVHRNKEAKSRSKAAFSGIQILTKENPTPLDMAKGYLATYDKFLSIPIMIDSAGIYLARSDEAYDKKFTTLIHYLFLKEDYGRMLENAEKWPGDKKMDAWTAYRIGEAHYKLGHMQQALSYFSQATDLLPFHLDFLEKKGMALIGLRRLDEGIKTLQAVLSENPERPMALCNLGYAHVLRGELQKGEKLYDKAIALDPDYEQALLNKAALLIFNKRRKEAEKLLKRVLKINPKNEEARHALQR